MEPPAKRQRLSPPAEQQQRYQSSSDDDEFYAPALPKEQPKQQHEAPEETDADDEVEILDEGEEVEEIDEAEVNIRRTQSLNKVRSRWDEICAKYGREFENADEIDLNTLEVVVDKGHISRMRDENDVGNAQPTPRRERLKAQHVVDPVLSRPKDGGEEQNTNRNLSPSKYRDPPKAQQTIYEDESSDDDFLYEKPAPSVVLAPRQPQGINQVKPRSGSRTVVEKRTVITTRRITTSTIRDDRTSSRDENSSQRSRESTREVHRYKSSQEKIVETSSDDELVQRSPPHQSAQIEVEPERPPSPKGKVSLWAPRMKAGRPRLAYDERGTPQRHVSRRDRTPRYDEHGRKIRKQRNDRGKMRKPEHLRKTKFVQRYPHLHQGSERSETSTTENPSSPSRLSAQRPQLLPDRTDSSMSIPATTSEEVPKPEPAAKPVVFARNTVDKSYDFSDEEDDALPQRPLPSLLTASPADVFIGQATAPGTELLQVKLDEDYAHLPHHKSDDPIFNPPHSPPPPYTEYDYQPSPMSAYNPSIDHTDYAAPMAHMAHMETVHGFMPLEDDSQDTSGFMDTYLSFPETSQDTALPQHAHDFKPHENTHAVEEEAKLESEDDLHIPIDPALLALDAENRAASLGRAELEVASDPTDEPGMEGAPVPTLPFEEFVGYKKSLQETVVEDNEDDSDEDLFAPQPPAPAPQAMIHQRKTSTQDKKVDEDSNGSADVGEHDKELAEALGEALIDASIADFHDDADGLVHSAISTINEQQPAGAPEERAPTADVKKTEVSNDEDDLVHSTLPMEPQHKPPVVNEKTPAIRNVKRTEVPDSDADSEDEFLTQPSSQPPPRTFFNSSQPSSAQVTPRTKEAMKRTRFSANLILDETPKPKLSPTPASIFRGTKTDQSALPPSPPSFQPQPLSDPVEEVEDDDDDDLALVPSTPAARTKSRTKAILEAAPVSQLPAPAPSQTISRPTPPVSRALSAQSSGTPIERPRRNELASSTSNLKRCSFRSVTPQPPFKSASGSKSTPVSRATPPRLFSLSVSPQPIPKRKLRASLLSESSSTTPRRAATATPPPQPEQVTSIRRSGAAGRLLGASPSIGVTPPAQRRPREDWS